MLRPRRPRQEVRCCNRFVLRWGFYVVIEFGQDQEFLCHDKIFLRRNRVDQGEENLCRDRFWSRPKVFMS